MESHRRLLPEQPIVSIDEYVARWEGGHGIIAARQRTTESIIELIERSGLRGRGGAGFPTGRKWHTIASTASGSPAVVVNAAEGEPGTFKDRHLLRFNPYAVLEGACIAAQAMRADEIIIALKASFTREVERLSRAIGEVASAGWFDGRTVRIVEGPGEYLFGEETALLEVVEGRPPFPRVVPPYRRGIHDADTSVAAAIAPPTLVDNVETLANVPGILHHGADWFRSVGTSQSPGTILCTVTGDIPTHGVGEYAMGTVLRDVLDDLGGGVPDVAAILMGVSNPPLGPEKIDLPLTYEDLDANSSGLGSASFIVVGADRALADVAAGVTRFLSVESCGQCTPCKRDGTAIARGLADGADVRTLLDTVARGARCALAGQTERVGGRLLDLARSQASSTPTRSTFDIVPLVDIVSGRARLDTSHLGKRADWSFDGDENDSHQDPVQRYADSPVTIRPAHVRERASATALDGGGGSDRDSSDPFDVLHLSHRGIEGTIEELRSAAPDERRPLVERLGAELARHRGGLERYVYPLLDRLEPDIGADVAWYPMHHDHHAARLIERLGHAEQALSPHLIDELCADVHASIIEIDRRVLPLIENASISEPRLQAIADDVAADLAVDGHAAGD